MDHTLVHDARRRRLTPTRRNDQIMDTSEKSPVNGGEYPERAAGGRRGLTRVNPCGRTATACLRAVAALAPSGRAYRREELADLELEAAAVLGERLRRGEHLRGGRAGLVPCPLGWGCNGII